MGGLSALGSLSGGLGGGGGVGSQIPSNSSSAHSSAESTVNPSIAFGGNIGGGQTTIGPFSVAFPGARSDTGGVNAPSPLSSMFFGNAGGVMVAVGVLALVFFFVLMRR